jgi:hypothetical protein
MELASHVGLQVPTRYIRDFSMVNVSVASKIVCLPNMLQLLRCFSGRYHTCIYTCVLIK